MAILLVGMLTAFVVSILAIKFLMSYIKKNYPDCKVLTIEIEKNRTEVKLSNRVEVTFNKNNEVIDIDMD